MTVRYQLNAPYPEKPLHRLFEEQAARTPDALALLAGEKSLSFRELDQRANRLSNHLLDHGVRRHDRVGICLDRSPDAIVAALAVLKTGAAYVPLDPNYPPARLAFIAEDTGLKCAVTHTDQGHLLSQGIDRICVDRDADLIAAHPTAPPEVGSSPDDWCFVVYTSGSTGQPKGVASPHRSTVVMLSWLWSAYPFTNDERFSHRTTLNFIVSVWEIFGALLQGVPVALAPREASRDPQALIAFLERARVTRLLLVPTLLNALLQAAASGHGLPKSLKMVITVGEPLHTELARRLLEHRADICLLNLYGCSETHSALCHEARPPLPDLPIVPIGTPLSNRRVYLLDTSGVPVDDGAIGELVIAGDGVSGGYINRPEQSAKQFGAMPGLGEALVYRTGDLARRLADGSLYLLGRSDNQVQVRGHRVEPEEIEAVLLSHSSVRQCAVAPRHVGGELVLSAYVVPEGEAASPADLREHIKGRLPAEFMPATFSFLEALPTTANGKLDRRALPDPVSTRALPGQCVPPRTPTEATVRTIWEQILLVSPIGVMDNFFDLGGYSNRAANCLIRIRDELGVELSLERFFQLQTIEKIAEDVDVLRMMVEMSDPSEEDTEVGVL
ncbi:non-ribosomal peptide synthetase [Bradyrhizobium sp. AUGA SZCCT0274]|uniref:non-ribosomal peptide synthetase n=1 Tax=Bradyrhizobium sp. AUGA SZCCT0274 TaxID=2807670 RepID=UPI001BAD44AA|nr:non-ribosomal peptide synthetase [Bradyrhizobium sp. AUGA SZCCT0274]MBR1240329.1 non-ribosomal peptide synthetase [Bradyrhizobium sp. AUGA SZCCT0274]